MNEAAYLAAALPEPVRCLGQELEPFSLIHEMLLQQHQNIFILSNEDFDKLDPDPEKIIAHLFLGVFICCHRFPEVNRALRRADLKNIGDHWRAAAKKAGIDEAAEVRKFKAYVQAGHYFPPFEPIKQRGRRSRKSEAPWLLQIFRTLTANFTFSREEAFNCPLAEAHWLYVGWWESQGTARFVDREEQRRNWREVHEAAAAAGLKVIRFANAEVAQAAINREEGA